MTRVNPHGLCLETKGREILARLVHGEIDAAMRIGLFDRVEGQGTPGGLLDRANDSTAGRAKAPARVKRTR